MLTNILFFNSPITLLAFYRSLWTIILYMCIYHINFQCNITELALLIENFTVRNMILGFLSSVHFETINTVCKTSWTLQIMDLAIFNCHLICTTLVWTVYFLVNTCLYMILVFWQLFWLSLKRTIIFNAKYFKITPHFF